MGRHAPPPAPVAAVHGSLLAWLEPPARHRLLDGAVRRSFAAGEVLQHEGDPTTHVLVLLHGWVRVSKSTADGRVVLLALRGPGDVLGELAAIDGRPRTATVRSIEPVDVAQLSGQQFVACFRSDPEIAVATVRSLSARLRDAESARVELATLDVGERVAGYLHHMAAEHGRDVADGVAIAVPLTQQDIADRLGASRRAVARALMVLRDRGLIRTSRREVLLLRPHVLAALAAGR
ncbi:Crp/Fnr family transcriptional regulator [Pseudonocardia lacus]|uniref:Crp/Fnr family transcriptional regulator n=1 Tax=Pseudonocardia lacus TaxID=2835865 RepID=UPI001BDCEAB0|nr:Crp/Fnr family transcriptional regulator [Pseudonocardia lacus]